MTNPVDTTTTTLKGKPRKRAYAPRRKYTPAEIEKILHALVMLGGPRAVERELGIAHSTVQKIKADHLDRFLEIAEREAPRIERLGAQDALEIMLLSKAATAKALHDLIDGDHNPKDAAALSTVARNAATVTGIATDKRLVLTGRPSVITETRNADDILRELKTRFPGAVVNSTAEELPAGELAQNAESPADTDRASVQTAAD